MTLTVLAKRGNNKLTVRCPYCKKKHSHRIKTTHSGEVVYSYEVPHCKEGTMDDYLLVRDSWN